MKKIILVVGLVLVSLVGYGQEWWNDSSTIITSGEKVEIVKKEIEKKFGFKYVEPLQVLHTAESVRDFLKKSDWLAEKIEYPELTVASFTYFESFEESLESVNFLLRMSTNSSRNYTVILEKYNDLYKITCYRF